MPGSDILFKSGAADSQHFSEDLDPDFHLYAALDPDQAFHFNEDPDLIQLLFKVTGICDHWSIDPPGPILSV
jgi:hypothetical protein